MRFPWPPGRGFVASLVAAALCMPACGGGTIRVIAGSELPITGLNAEEQQLFDQAQAAMNSAGCTPVLTVPPYAPASLDRFHVGGSDLPVPPPLSSYASQPPASGPHAPSPLPSGVYQVPPPVDRTIHSLEHAAVITWYSPKAASDPSMADELAKLQVFFGKDRESDHVIVAPYDYPDQGPAGMLPAETTMALVAWHRRQVCRDISLPVAFAFVTAYRFDPNAPDRYQGEAPETGVPIG
jgi:hypothetical protein